MADPEYWRLSAVELLRGYVRREFSPVQVLDEQIERIERLNPLLHAYLAVTADDARAAARQAQQAWLSPGEKPLLCGVPTSVKDTIEMQGTPTTYGSLAFKDNYQDDSEIVSRLRRAGAVILGKTNTPEFALLSACQNRLGPAGANPWNLAHTCGGSSGGAAAAVAAGLGPLAVGTDSGGSIRGPAAVNGVFGLKPTYQRIPAVQVWRAAPGRSHNGPLTRTVRDSALLMQALAGFDRRDSSSNLPDEDWMQFTSGTVRGATVALSSTLGFMETRPEMRKLLEEAAALLRFLGCTVIEADPPALTGRDELDDGVWAYAGDHYAAAESMLPNFWEKHADDLADYTYPIYEGGRRGLAWKYRLILRRNMAYVEQMKEWFRHHSYDFALCPVAEPARRLGEVVQRDRGNPRASYTQQFNISFHPAASVPFGFSEGGLPLGLQIIGRFGADISVLRLAAAIEAHKPWALHWPPVALGERVPGVGHRETVLA